jgi:hypothetical protein
MSRLNVVNKSGRGPPTAPTLRPRVLTPRDHFVHRGGERSRIMQQSSQTFNRLGEVISADLKVAGSGSCRCDYGACEEIADALFLSAGQLDSKR